MCLDILHDDTEKLKKTLSKTGKIKVYKLYAYLNNVSKTSPSYICRFHGPEISIAGIIKSDRKTKDLTKKEWTTRQIEFGIHVFLKRSDAIKYKASLDFMVVAEASLSDFVAAGSYDGYDSAVFMKIKVNKKSMMASFRKLKALNDRIFIINPPFLPKLK